jgi:hypothetical protein
MNGRELLDALRKTGTGPFYLRCFHDVLMARMDNPSAPVRRNELDRWDEAKRNVCEREHTDGHDMDTGTFYRLVAEEVVRLRSQHDVSDAQHRLLCAEESASRLGAAELLEMTKLACAARPDGDVYRITLGKAQDIVEAGDDPSKMELVMKKHLGTPPPTSLEARDERLAATMAREAVRAASEIQEKHAEKQAAAQAQGVGRPQRPEGAEPADKSMGKMK